MLAFGELVTSSNLFTLFERDFHILSGMNEMGMYIQGIPLRNSTDFVWGSNSGIRTLPLLFFYNCLQAIFGNFWEYIYLIIAIIFPLFGFLFAIRIIKKLDIFSILGAIFYSFNIWIIDRVFTGFWQLNIVYSFVPILITISIRISQRNLILRKLFFWSILYSLATSAIIIAQPHFIIFVLIFTLFQIIITLINKKFLILKQLFTFYLISTFIIFIYSSYLFIPSLLYPERTFTAPEQYFSLAAVLQNSKGVELSNVIKLTSELNSSEIIEILKFLPLTIAFIFFIIDKKRKWIYLVCLLTFVFLGKGIHEPLSNLGEWIYLNIPIFHFFRDSSRFIAAVILFGSLIIANVSIPKVKRSLKLMMLISLILLFIIIDFNVVLGKYSYFTDIAIPQEYKNLQNFISTLPKDDSYRIMTMPNEVGMYGYNWYKGESGLSSKTIFSMLIPLPLPLADTTDYADTYANQANAFFYQKFLSSFDSRIIAPLGVKYILIDRSITKSADIIKFSDKEILKLNYKKIFTEGNLNLYILPEYSPIYSNKEPIFAIGDFTTILNQYLRGNDRPVILLNQDINAQNISSQLLKNKHLLIDTDRPELTLTSEKVAPKYYLDIFKSTKTLESPFISYEPYKEVYIRNYGLLYTSGQSVISNGTSGEIKTDKKLIPRRYTVLVKGLTEGTGAKFQLKLDNREYSYNLFSSNLIWHNLGVINLENEINSITFIKPDNSYLQIDYLVIIPEAIYENELQNVTNILSNMKNIRFDPPYIPKSETSFNIEVSRVSTSTPQDYLTYLYSYGDHWTSNNQSIKFISNGYGMSFISKNEPIESIDYIPDKIYIISICISIGTITLSMLSLMILFYRRKKLMKIKVTM